MWENSLKNVESDNNKILYETLLDLLQLNGTYFLNKPRILCNQTNFREGQSSLSFHRPKRGGR